MNHGLSRALLVAFSLTVLAACGSSESDTSRVGRATPPPTVASLTPMSFRGNQATTVTVTGTNFSGIIDVQIANTGMSIPFNIISDTMLTAQIPAGLPGGVQGLALFFGPIAISPPAAQFTILGRDHVLITEVGNGQGTSANDFEFVEVFNPTTAPVSLQNYYLTDGTNTTGNNFYYNITLGTPMNETCWSGLSSDFIARFPLSTTLQPNQYITVALINQQANGTMGTGGGAVHFFDNYGRNPDFEIVPGGDADSIPDMLDLQISNGFSTSSIGNQSGITNGDEVIILFAWDGSSALVQDVDYFIYGPTNTGTNPEAVDKTGVTINGSTYRNDTPLAQQNPQVSGANTSNNGIPQTYQRIDLFEGNEGATGGNGITGNNETSENLGVTFRTDMQASPGFDYPASPRGAATNVDPATTVSYRFFRGVSSSTIPSATTFRVMQGGTMVQGTVSFDATTNTVTFTPTAALMNGTTYQVIIDSSIQRDDNVTFFTPGQNFTWNFTTAP